MKQLLIFIIICFLLVGCKTLDYLPKQYKVGEVEYFDFEDFYKKRKKDYSAYYYEDGQIEMLKSIKKDFLYETFAVYSKNYKLVKEYYPNGMIKERGKEYYHYGSDNFKIGKWEYFDEQGKLIKVEDKDGKDRDYDMTYKEAFRKVAWQYGFSKKNLIIEIFLVKEGIFWVFSRKGKSRAVNMKTGKVKKVTISHKK
jgi:hypothetical protein